MKNAIQVVQLPASLDVEGLASLFKLKPKSINNALCKNPDRLPKPLPHKPKQRLLWLTSDVLEWLKSPNTRHGEVGNNIHDNTSSLPVQPKRKRGRPSKLEQRERCKHTRDMVEGGAQ
jgi:hypothetical protein